MLMLLRRLRPLRAWTQRSFAANDSAHAFDLLVIGSGPAGQKCAINAAKLQQRVAIGTRPHTLRHAR